ncbi:MAG: hypothetical protein F4201_04010 [Nitrospira sp. SB0677_bin_15]|nr:hypothetical protein [Nitrospira sp. SB0677_bin_15]MYH01554.1 hypothetical protein [Nitrospira sp. SB0675_bin_23]
MTTEKLETIQENRPQGDAEKTGIREQALLNAEAESAQHRTALHKWVSEFIPKAVQWWLFLLVLLIFLDSIDLAWSSPWFEAFDFDIDTYVMVALVGSTSLAVGGLVNYALKSLLGKPHE